MNSTVLEELDRYCEEESLSADILTKIWETVGENYFKSTGYSSGATDFQINYNAAILKDNFPDGKTKMKIDGKILEGSNNMSRQEIARYFEDLVVDEELIIPFGGYEGRKENKKGNDFHRVLYSFLRKLEGGVDVYSQNFILVFWDSRWEGPIYGNHCWRFDSDYLALDFIETAFCKQAFEEAMWIPTYDQRESGETKSSLEEKRILGYFTPPKSSFNDDSGMLSKAQKKAKELLGKEWKNYNMSTNQFPPEVAEKL